MQTSRVNCIARIRPLLEQEQDSDRSITVDTDDATIMLRNTNRGNGRYIRKYKMSKALDKVDQTHMFEQVLPLLQDAIAGYNTSIFCYGQTGTGKTYTMLGYDFWAIAGLAAKSHIPNKRASLSSSVGSEATRTPRRSSTMNMKNATSPRLGSSLSARAKSMSAAASSGFSSSSSSHSSSSGSNGGEDLTDAVNNTASQSPSAAAATSSSSSSSFPAFADISASLTENSEDAGLIPRALEWLFIQQKETIANNGYSAATAGHELPIMKFYVTYVEIYNESVRDLLMDGALTHTGIGTDTGEKNGLSTSPDGKAQQQQQQQSEPSWKTPLWISMHPEAAHVHSYVYSGPKLKFGNSNTIETGLGSADSNGQKEPPSLRISHDHDGSIQLPGVTQVLVNSLEDALQLLWVGAKTRSVATTDMNTYSSRSHTLFRISLERTTSGKRDKNNTQLNFVDLAGSEKIDKFSENLTPNQVKELTCINQSLANLSNVINALAESGRKDKECDVAAQVKSDKEKAQRAAEAPPLVEETKSEGDAVSKKHDERVPTHIPYRNSKLTHLLQDSLGGSARTLFVCTLSPSMKSAEESCSTLMFADRAMQIQVRAVPTTVKHDKSLVNSLPEANAAIAVYKEQIADLTHELRKSKSCLEDMTSQFKKAKAELEVLRLSSSINTISTASTSVNSSSIVK